MCQVTLPHPRVDRIIKLYLLWVIFSCLQKPSFLKILVKCSLLHDNSWSLQLDKITLPSSQMALEICVISKESVLYELAMLLFPFANMSFKHLEHQSFGISWKRNGIQNTFSWIFFLNNISCVERHNRKWNLFLSLDMSKIHSKLA